MLVIVVPKIARLHRVAARADDRLVGARVSRVRRQAGQRHKGVAHRHVGQLRRATVRRRDHVIDHVVHAQVAREVECRRSSTSSSGSAQVSRPGCLTSASRSIVLSRGRRRHVGDRRAQDRRLHRVAARADDRLASDQESAGFDGTHVSVTKASLTVTLVSFAVPCSSP